LALSEATGQGVRIATIDSGVAPRHPHLGPVVAGASVQEDGTIRVGLEHAVDRLGHGTAVMAAIQEKAPAADYLAVKVFHEGLATSAANLLRAIDWCIAREVAVVNLSLGTVNAVHRDAFAGVAGDACAAGCLLVAAREANGQPCYPGTLASVIGVDLDWDCPRETYRCVTIADETTFRASGYPRPIPGVPPRRNLHGISFAVANMSGFVARACEIVGPDCAPRARLLRVRELLMQRLRDSATSRPSPDPSHP
jgi:subtilisin family serine protease